MLNNIFSNLAPNRLAKSKGDKRRSAVVEVNLRVLTVCQWLAEGFSRKEILEFVRVQWGVGRAMTDIYLKKARELINQEITRNFTDYFTEHLYARRHLRSLALQNNKLDVALRAMQDEAKLAGLYQISEGIMIGKLDLEKLTDQQLERLAAGENPLTVVNPDDVIDVSAKVRQKHRPKKLSNIANQPKS